MIPLAGNLPGESFRAVIGKCNDVTIHMMTERGQRLAHALGGRRASAVGIRPEVCYFFTPVRAIKWHLLWSNGFTVRSIKIYDVIHWRYAGLGKENLTRRSAIALARETERAKAAQLSLSQPIETKK